MKTKLIRKWQEKFKDLGDEFEMDFMDMINDRENYVGERSEKWQESDNCSEYEEVTEAIDSVKDDVSYNVEEIVSHLETLLEI